MPLARWWPSFPGPRRRCEIPERGGKEATSCRLLQGQSTNGRLHGAAASAKPRHMRSIWKILAAATVLVAACCGSAPAQDRFITVASTTSTEQSGLFGYLLPRFTEANGIAVKVVAVGT